MLSKVRNTIKKNGLLQKGDSVTVGLSGGADSVTLMSVLYALREEFELTLSAVHVNHGIRGDEALRDENFVVAFCKEKNIPLTVFHKDIPLLSEESGESEEECGRRIRYECFNEAAGGGKIATAHTLSDSVETMIFNMLRGSSLTGLCGVPAKRDNIIRPLIECTREEIENYCEENGLLFVNDSTNLQSEYTRNYIRRDVLPMFERVNPSYMTALSRLNAFINEDSEYLTSEAEKLLGAAKNENGLSCEILIDADKVLSKRAIVSFIKNKCGVCPEEKHISLIYGNLEKDFTLQISDRFFVSLKNGILSVDEKAYIAEKLQCIPLIEGENLFGSSVISAKRISREEFINYNKNEYKNAIDCDKIKGDIVIRSRQEGDSVYLYKRKVTKSLKKLFVEMKIPKEERNLIPVIGDSEKVLWSAISGANGNCCVTYETKNVLLIGYIPKA